MSSPGSAQTTLCLIHYAFPSPTSAFRDLTAGLTERHGGKPGALYCVGGAVYMFAHHLKPELASGRERFPNIGRIADALRTLNPRLDRGLAGKYAVRITQANDFLPWRGRQCAWRTVECALKEPWPTAKKQVRKPVPWLRRMLAFAPMYRTANS